MEDQTGGVFRRVRSLDGRKVSGLVSSLEDFKKLKHPLGWLAAVVLASGIGLATSFICFETVHLWQMKVLPPGEIGVLELLAKNSVWYTLKHWFACVFWYGLYIGSLVLGIGAGCAFYRWAVKKYDLHRWREGTKP